MVEKLPLVSYASMDGLVGSVDTNALATSTTAFVIFFLLFLYLMAISSGAEVAFFSLNAKDINNLKTKEKNGSLQAIRLLEYPDRLASTLKGLKFLSAIALICLSFFYLYFVYDSYVEISALSFLLIFCFSLLVVLILFGEILPKVYARENNLRLALFSAPTLTAIQDLIKPLTSILTDSKEYKNEKLSRQHQLETDSREFEEAVEISLGHAASKEEVDIFRGILKFGKITAKQIMHPRMDIVGIRNDWAFSRVKKKILSACYSRLPIYSGTVDNIVGLIHTKDFLPYIEQEDLDWHQLVRPAYFIHEHKLIDDLLREFQQKKNHFAVIVDEFGGTSGILTLEDIMEEIIGDIRDEHDKEDIPYQKIHVDLFLFDGKTLLSDFSRVMGKPFEYFEAIRGESNSLAGLLLEIAGRFPSINDQIIYKDFEFTVLSIQQMRIGKIKVHLLPKETIDKP